MGCPVDEQYAAAALARKERGGSRKKGKVALSRHRPGLDWFSKQEQPKRIKRID